MKIPAIRGIIDRRILVNYRADRDVVASLLPAPFRPKVVNGFAMVGICLIRLKQIRPAFLPSFVGISSENAAHRTAVDWEEKGISREGVYVRRRDTNSRLNTIAGGRLFPGVHHHACFVVKESADRFEVALRSDDGETNIAVRGHVANCLPTTSVFASLEDASAFYQRDSMGYSATSDPARFQGLELRCLRWQVEPLSIDEVRSSYFDDQSIFPAGSIEFDCALLMRGIEHEWHGQSDLCQCTDGLVPA